MSRHPISRALPAALVLALASACGGESSSSSSAPAGTAKSSAASSVPLTGTIVEIAMHTNETGNYYEPANVTVKPGDRLRFKLVTGVHNVNFLPDSNPGAQGLPPMSLYLQLPGQTLDIPATFGNGRFFYQCDPHALLGMVGWITVAP
jgi:plastocyanin